MKIFIEIANAGEARRDHRPGVSRGMAKPSGEIVETLSRRAVR